MNVEIEKQVVELTEWMRSRFFGKYRGIVKEIEEDGNQGRIKAVVPEVYHDKVSPWAMPSVPFAGKNHGVVFLPEVGDGVWIEFEGGDLARPIWSGFWWSNNEMPQDSGKQTRVLVTSAGHKIIIDEDDDELNLIHPGGAKIKMTNSEITLEISATKVILSSSGVSVRGSLEVS